MSNDVELKGIRVRESIENPPAYDNLGYTNNEQRAPQSAAPGDGAHTNSGYTSEPERNGAISEVDPPPKVGDSTVSLGDVDHVIDDEEEQAPPNCFMRKVETIQNWTSDMWAKHKKTYWLAFKLVLLVGYFVYFGFAIAYSVKHFDFKDEATIRLVWVTCLVVFCLVLSLVWKYSGKSITEQTESCWKPLSRHSIHISWIIIAIVFLIVIIFLIVDVTTLSKKPYNLVSLSGIALYVIIFFVCSHSPAKVQWRAVVWGLGLQFVFALFILRWDRGYDAFRCTWLGDRVTEFLLYTDAGSEFVFGSGFREHFFAFQVLPTIVFFSTFISVLYYLGAMQAVINKVAWVMQAAMGTTAGESLNAAGNIFVGQTEAPLLIRPLMKDMTRSELHAVMTGGFATIAGGVLAAYILFGVPANHLISASVMSAPAALAMSKLLYPETEKSKTTARDVQKMEKSPQRNIIEAASAGASASIKLVANVAANLIAFIALLEFLNTTLTWFGNRVGVDELTFQFICSYVLWPFALTMGVDVRDCRRVARLIGVKTFLNEFIAYRDLGFMLDNKVALDAHVDAGGEWTWDGEDVQLWHQPWGNNTVLENGFLTDRSATIATYALCGFANVGSIGIQLGGLGAMAPERRPDLARIALRAMIAGNVACFLTACVAGLFYQG